MNYAKLFNKLKKYNIGGFDEKIFNLMENIMFQVVLKIIQL